MKGGSLGSSEFNAHAIGQSYGIIARRSIFGFVGEFHLTHIAFRHGQQGNVAQIADACSAKVQLSEADDDGVAVVIARTPVPTLLLLRGTCLDMAKRNVGSEEHMSVSSRANKGVYVLRIVSCDGLRTSPCAHNGYEWEHESQKHLFHCQSGLIIDFSALFFLSCCAA